MMFAKLYAVALPVFFLIDMVWLGLVAKGFYAKHIGFLMRSPPNWTAAIIFYLLFIAGLVVFVISPAVDRGQWQYALGLGAFFGLVTYATYDLTSQAVIKDWPVVVTVVDMIWGAVLAASVSTIAYWLATRFVI
jgi:uncharacterized membrane protein